MNKEQLAALAEKYLNGTATEEEKKQLNEWYDDVENDMQTQPSENFFITSEETESRILGNMMSEINAGQQTEQVEEEGNRHSKILTMKTPVKWIAAASVLLTLLLSLSFYFQRAAPKKIVASVNRLTAPAPVVMPGSNKARLVLPSGEVVILQDVENGKIKNNSGLEISKKNGELIFKAAAPDLSSAPEFNTVFTPRGGQYQVQLPDGSKVWLNAASSLKFPGYFSGKTREVELTGEGYFEIAKNAAMPFRVKVNNMQVEVLGTHFNIMSYADENEINTTLLEGSVKVTQGSATNMLKPGQQASLNKQAGKIKISTVDVDQAIAWKNGLFQFDGVTLESVMKQLSRWYNIDVLYKSNSNSAHFRGMISRSVDLSQVIKMLEMTGEQHFKIDGKTVTVLP